MLSPAPKVEELQERMSPSSDSQDPENEQDDSKGKRPEQHLQTATPTKKKRTRTLTTPHQAAVLHALLAQVRHLLPERTIDNHLTMILVSVSDHGYERGGWSFDWSERP